MMILNVLGILCFRVWCINNMWEAVTNEFPKWSIVLAWSIIINVLLLAIYFIILIVTL